MAKKILLVNMGSLGDIHPFMGLAHELMRQGAEVLFVTGETYKAYVESFGIPCATARPNLNPNDKALLEALLDQRRGPARLNRDFIFKHIRLTFEDIAALTDDYDLIVAGALCFFAPTLSEVKKVPWVSVTLSPILLWSVHDVPVIPQAPGMESILRRLGPRFSRVFFRAIFRSTESWAKELYKLRRDLGLPRGPSPFGGMMHSPYLNLMLFSRHLASAQVDWPQPFRQPGFIDFDGRAKSTSPELTVFLEAGDAPILYTLGSTASELPGPLIEAFVESAKLHPYRSLFVVGEASATKYASLNSSRLHFTGYVPYSEVMPQAKVIVHQGGIGTTAQALRSGRPSLAVALVNDQPDNGMHLRRTGAGDWLHARKLSAARLADKICQLATNPSFEQSAQDISGRLRLENATAVAANEILKVES